MEMEYGTLTNTNKTTIMSRSTFTSMISGNAYPQHDSFVGRNGLEAIFQYSLPGSWVLWT
jgi:hypothetical protein